MLGTQTCDSYFLWRLVCFAFLSLAIEAQPTRTFADGILDGFDGDTSYLAWQQSLSRHSETLSASASQMPSLPTRIKQTGYY